MRIEQTFEVARPPESVFDYMTNPANLRDWQTSTTRVEVHSEGEPRAGYRIREWTKVPWRRSSNAPSTGSSAPITRICGATWRAGSDGFPRRRQSAQPGASASATKALIAAVNSRRLASQA
jgi:uncharacterized protein YndB with AHSA1/START domain